MTRRSTRWARVPAAPTGVCGSSGVENNQPPGPTSSVSMSAGGASSSAAANS
ncbi:hypothetical protein [Streptomyces sp. NPDC050988]|uniref:hypothetical protein n=1 Tax=Streptomyces sp. NPDC050988 TaxID=3365637 RepID=UPI00379F469A